MHKQVCKSTGLSVMQQISSAHVGAGILICQILAPSSWASIKSKRSLLNCLYRCDERNPPCLNHWCSSKGSDISLFQLTWVVAFWYNWFKISQYRYRMFVKYIFLIKACFHTSSKVLCPSRVTAKTGVFFFFWFVFVFS